MRPLSLLAALIALGAAPAAAAQVSYAGALSDASGQALSGSYLLRFVVVGEGAGAKEPWTEQRYVKSEAGRFSAVLGSRKPLPDSALSGGYRILVEAPPGTGWVVSAVGAAPAPLVRPDGSALLATPAGELGRLERELDQARRDREESRRRLEALERAVTAPAAPAAAPASRIYVVLEGETLKSVARKTLGDERHWVLIYQANSDRIQRAGELSPGQKLVIPGAVR